MGRLALKNIQVKGGRIYYRRQINGRDTYIRLPALDSPDFAAEYARLEAGSEGPPPPAEGTIGALAVEFRKALAKRPLADKTRANYARYIDRIAAEHGHRSVKGLRPAHCYIIRDGLADTPGVANNYMAVLRLMMAYACQRDMRDTNPAAGIPALQIGEHDPWPEDVLAKVLEDASPMTRLAVVTGLCSGQRIGDCIRMQHNWHRDGIMELVQEKTGKPVAIPMHPMWLAEIAAHPKHAITILYDRSRRPFQSTATLRERVGDALAKAGRPDLTFHGLRKNAACYLSETGLTDEQIGAITGMSPDMVRHYTKGVRVVRLARNVADQVKAGTPTGAGPGRGENGPR